MLEADAAVERDRGLVEVVDVERDRQRDLEQAIANRGERGAWRGPGRAARAASKFLAAAPSFRTTVRCCKRSRSARRRFRPTTACGRPCGEPRPQSPASRGAGRNPAPDGPSAPNPRRRPQTPRRARAGPSCAARTGRKCARSSIMTSWRSRTKRGRGCQLATNSQNARTVSRAPMIMRSPRRRRAYSANDGNAGGSAAIASWRPK